MAIVFAVIGARSAERTNNNSRSTERRIAANNSEQTTSTTTEPHTRQLLINTLERLQLPYHVDYDSEDKSIWVDYQGFHFRIIALDDRRLINIIFYCWHSVSQFDIDEVSRVYRIVNKSNGSSYITTVYSKNTEDNTIDLHSHTFLVFTKEMPQLDILLHNTLDKFLRTRADIVLALDRLRDEDERAASAKE